MVLQMSIFFQRESACRDVPKPILVVSYNYNIFLRMCTTQGLQAKYGPICENK